MGSVPGNSVRIARTIEFWKDQAAIDAHNTSEHIDRILPLLGAMFAKASEADLFTET